MVCARRWCRRSRRTVAETGCWGIHLRESFLKNQLSALPLHLKGYPEIGMRLYACFCEFRLQLKMVLKRGILWNVYLRL